MKLTVISNTFTWLSGNKRAVHENNNDNPNKLFDQLHDFYPAQNTTE